MTEQPIDLALFDAVAYREWTEGTSVVLIPVGAFEQHGPHMPLGTDAILSTAMALSLIHISEPTRLL